MITYTESHFRRLKNESPKNGSSLREVQILSNSMEPVLQVGARYFVKPLQAVDLRRFDIIVYWNKEILVAHYVWHINRQVDAGLIITRALLTGREDLPLSSQQIVGKLVGVSLPWWRKWLLLFFKS